MNRRIILGIDPGSRQTGYALLTETGTRIEVLECGTIRSAGFNDQSDRLRYIYRQVQDLIRKQSPTHCAVETPVYGVDPLAMLKLGRAQAAALLAIANAELPVSEYYPKAVKKAVSGNGNASKKQVAYMLKKLMTLPDRKLTEDATDAIAVAWCHQLHLDGPSGGSKRYHQNNRKSDWASFIEQNPERVKK